MELLGGILAAKSAHAHFSAENTPDSCTKGTRTDIIAQILSLCKTPAAQLRIIFLSGSAGSGKSTIAKTVSQELAAESYLAASFFFSARFEGRVNASALSLALAHQLGHYNLEFKM